MYKMSSDCADVQNESLTGWQRLASGASNTSRGGRRPSGAYVKIAAGLFIAVLLTGGLLTFFGLLLGGTGKGLRKAVPPMAMATMDLTENPYLIYLDGQEDLERPKVQRTVRKLDIAQDQYERVAKEKIEGLAALRNRNFTFIINVIGWRRRASMKRLVKSLEAARYHNFTTKLHFHLDGEAHPLVKEYVEEYQWPHGRTLMNLHAQRSGLESTIVNSWDARNDNQFAFFFEDDIEVAPDYFEYAMLCLQRYVFPDPEGPRANTYHANHLVGIALNTPRFNEIVDPPYRWVPQHAIGQDDYQFAFQLANSWGCMYFPWAWREYLSYYSWRKSANLPNLHKVIPDSRIYMWERSWKKSLIELMYFRGYIMIYPNLPGQHAFSIHHREKGEHTAKAGEDPLVDGLGDLYLDYFTVPLVTNRAHVHRLFATMKPLPELPVVSFHHERVENILKLVPTGFDAVDALEPYGFDLELYNPNPGCVLDFMTPVIKELPEADQHGEKFLFYLGQGSPFEQIFALENAFAYAKILNRTVIIPPLTFQNNVGYGKMKDQIATMDWLFDLKAMRNAGPWTKFINWSDVSTESVWVQRIVEFRPKSTRVKPLSDKLLSRAGIVPIYEVVLPFIKGSDEQIKAQFGNCQDKYLTFRSLNNAFHYHGDQELESKYRAWVRENMKLKERFQTIFNKILEPFPSPIGCIAFTRGDAEGGCGTGIEFPTEDLKKLAMYRNCNATAPRTIEYLIEAASKANIELASIYVITDDQSPRVVIPTVTQIGTKAIPIIRSAMLYELLNRKGTLQPDIAPIHTDIRQSFEYQICSEAVYFIGNQYSKFSMQVARIRKSTGKPTDLLGA